MKYVIHILIGILLLQPVAVLAASEGPNGPGSVTQDGSNSSWTDIENASVSDNAYAYAVHDSSGFWNTLIVSNFDFSLPVGATITGIVAEIEKFQSIGFTTVDSSLYLSKTPGITSISKADELTLWPTTDTDTATSYGGIDDTWGLSWSPSDINASTFSLFISPTYCAGCVYNLFQTVNIDSISITVYYTAASGVSRGNAGKTLRLKQKRSAGYVRSDVVPPTPQEVGIFRYLEQEDPVLVTAKQEREALQQLRVYEARKATVVQEIPPPRLVRLEKKKMEYTQGNRVQALHASAVEKEVPAMCGRVEKRLRGKSEEVKARAWKRVRMRSGYSCSL